MKATVDIPESLYRRVKARSAMDGRAIRDVTIELYERWLAERTAPDADSQARDAEASEAWLAGWEKLGDEIAQNAVDPRTSRQILIAERR